MELLRKLNCWLALSEDPRKLEWKRIGVTTNVRPNYHRNFTNKELETVVLPKPRMSIVGYSGDEVLFEKKSGFTLRNLLDAVLETERRTWKDGRARDHVFLEVLELKPRSRFVPFWGS